MCCCILVVKKCIHRHNYSIYIIYTVPVNRRTTLAFLLLLARLRRDRVCKIILCIYIYIYTHTYVPLPACPTLRYGCAVSKIGFILILEEPCAEMLLGRFWAVTCRVWWNSTHWLEWPRSPWAPQTDPVESRGVCNIFQGKDTLNPLQPCTSPGKVAVTEASRN